LKGKTLRPDKTDRDRFVPENAQCSPAGGHGIKMGECPRRDEHPIVVNPAEEIIVKGFQVDGFEQVCHLHFLCGKCRPFLAAKAHKSVILSGMQGQIPRNQFFY
jgi:hypothetical protein